MEDLPSEVFTQTLGVNLENIIRSECPSGSDCAGKVSAFGVVDPLDKSVLDGMTVLHCTSSCFFMDNEELFMAYRVAAANKTIDDLGLGDEVEHIEEI